MTDPSGDPSQHPRILARARIAKAREATNLIDKDLWGPIERLSSAGNSGNGDGIYADWQQFRKALVDARSAIDCAIKIVAQTDWPTKEDYDIA